MLNTILVPIGDAARSRNSVHQAAAISKALSARTYLLGLVQLYDEDDMLYKFTDPVSWNVIRSQKSADLTSLADELNEQDIDTETAMLDTYTSETFLQFVQDHGFDLIVFCEEDQLSSKLIRKSLIHTNIPVYMTRANSTDHPKRILLPLDGSQRAESVLPLATTLAHHLDATLILAHIIKEPDIPRRTTPNAEDLELAQQLTDRNRYEIEQYLNDLSTRLGVPTEKHIVIHHSVTAALHELIDAQNIDLVTLSAHGFSGKPDRSFGAIANNLIDYCSTSLIILQDLPVVLPSDEVEVNRRHLGAR